MEELFDAYVNDGRDRLARMVRGLAETDWPGIRFHAHALRGSSLSIGATRMAALCGSLEAAAAAEAEWSMPTFRELEKAFIAALAALSISLLGDPPA